ncbi:autotransporter domain-containing protein, partial [Acinetobacter baumannii]
ALGGVNLSGGKILKPYLSAYYVHAFRDQPSAFGANFVGGVGPNASFALAAQDKDWGEIGGGLSYATKDVTLSIGADTTAGRTD